jgi:hypothetical protein
MKVYTIGVIRDVYSIRIQIGEVFGLVPDRAGVRIERHESTVSIY